LGFKPALGAAARQLMAACGNREGPGDTTKTTTTTEHPAAEMRDDDIDSEEMGG
jgi:hypothetical protein